ncbi:cysteine hydrolase family protein [Pseudonocardia sp. H11422]|uniref:cysteine hydrolase family protein n=1 Tax=Pseudonocardia sp. H11422 TaxID=2835866 RepID=UPI001BDC9B32|nr:isochorismatase family cysteine hydrolase [Pseudonocardia sp. H11422]
MKTGLIILDMLEDFVHGVLANPAAKDIVEPITVLADEARRRDDWLVIYGNDAHRPGDFEFAVFGEHALAGSPGARVIPELRPEADDIIVPKRNYSAFSGTDLDTTCRVHDLGRVVIVGQHTDCCCRHTAYDAFRRGIEVTVVRDATCVYQPATEGGYEQHQQAALAYLQNFYNADVMTARAVVHP